MRVSPLRAAIVCLTLLAVVAGVADTALAQASLFRPDPGAAPPVAPPTGIIAWLAAQQSAFYKLLIDALQAFRDNDAAGVWLVAASFLYGLFHAAGPGHGKAVLASYMLASHAAARRGIVLAVLSSMAQGLTALIAVGILVIALNATGARITESVWTLERISFALLTLFGVWMVWRKGVRPWLRPSAAGHDHAHHHDHLHAHGPDCDHAHLPDAREMERPVSVREAIGIIASIGMRPCSGAIIILVFAISQKMLLAGVLSVVAISLGTAAIVVAVTLLAAGGRGLLLRAADRGGSGTVLAHRIVEVTGALLVFAFGLVLFLGSLGPRPGLF